MWKCCLTMFMLNSTEKKISWKNKVNKNNSSKIKLQFSTIILWENISHIFFTANLASYNRYKAVVYWLPKDNVSNEKVKIII
jgi:hypothetical protein